MPWCKNPTRLKHWDIREFVEGAVDKAPTQSHPNGFPSPPRLEFVETERWLCARVHPDDDFNRICWVPDDRRSMNELRDYTRLSWHGARVAIGSKAGLVTILDCTKAIGE